MNVKHFIGNVGKDPESQYTPSGKMVTKFSVAVNSGFGDNKSTEWHNCSVWGEKDGERIKAFVKKGATVEIVGRGSVRQWKSENGDTHTSSDVSVYEWEVKAGRKPKDEDSDNPFDGEEQG